jgi:hypothetical protein
MTGREVAVMSNATADLLFGAAPAAPELADLLKLAWRIVGALADGPGGTADMSFAVRGVNHPSCQPEMPDLDFSFPLPDWAAL